MEGDTDTGIFRKAKDVAGHPTTKKSAAIGGLAGGASTATIILCYQLFTTQTNFNTHATTEANARRALWERVSAVDARVEAVNKQAEWIKGFLTGSKILPSNNNTNTP